MLFVTRLLCGLVIGAFAVSVAAQEPEPVLIDDVSSPPTESLRNDDEPEKRRSAMAGLAALAGIAIVGIGLVALTILWAGRLRRLNRQPLPEAPLKNDLWFLKPPKSPPGSSLPPGDSPT
jgi:hypothetical protein